MLLACAVFLFATPNYTDGLPPYFVKLIQPRTLYAKNEPAQLILRVGNQSERSLKTKKLPDILGNLIVEHDGKRLTLGKQYSTKKLFSKISSINMGYHRDLRLNLRKYFPEIKPGNTYQVMYKDKIYNLTGKPFQVASVDMPPLDANYVLHTSRGDITLALEPDQAPEHCKNFAILVATGFYQDLVFHRVIDNYVIQTGDPLGTGLGGSEFSLALEKSPFLKHETFALGMARGEAPDSASSQFYICLNRIESLDGRYSLFGKVTDGFDVVKAIGKVATTGPEGRPPNKPIVNVELNSISIETPTP